MVFDDNEVIIPISVLDELDNAKVRPDELGRNARSVVRILDSLRSEGSLNEGVKLNKSIIRVELNHSSNIPSGLSIEKNDNRLISTALGLQKDGEIIIVVTKDINLRVKCDALGIKAQDYVRDKIATDLQSIYSGTQTLEVSSGFIDSLYENGYVTLEEVKGYQNQFFILKAGSQSALTRYKNNSLELCKTQKEVWGIVPRNVEQKMALNLLLDPNIKLVTLIGRAGSGKAQPINMPVLTPNGWIEIGKIKPGSFVVCPDGSKAKVISIHPQGKKEVYRVCFSDGTSTECCKEHLWKVQTTRNRWLDNNWEIKSLEEISNDIKINKKERRNYSIPIVEKIDFPRKKLPLDPYVLGMILGDGGITHHCGFSSKDKQIVEIIKEKISFCDMKQKNEYSNNGLKHILLELGLFGKKSEDKFIPDMYKFIPYNDRVALLQGLLDTDGTVEGNNNVYLSTSSPMLRDDVKELAQSLGAKVTIQTKTKPFYTHNGEKKRSKLDNYMVRIALPSSIAPFRLSRKKEKYIPRTKYKPIRYIDRVELVGLKESVCIYVDHPDHLYITNDYIVTHNTLLACASALQHVLNNSKTFQRTLISRPIQPMGRDLGFLPGPQPLDSKVLTPEGWKLMGDLKLGDEIIGRDGNSTKILGIFPKGKKKVYKISTIEGNSTECCEDHLWYVQNQKERIKGEKGKIRSTKEIRENLQHNNIWNYSLPRNEVVKYRNNEVFISPYVLGALIGDGSFKDRVCIYNIEDQIIDRISKEIPIEYRVSHNEKSKNKLKYTIVGSKNLSKNGMGVIRKNVETSEIVNYKSFSLCSKENHLKHNTLKKICDTKIEKNGFVFERFENNGSSNLFIKEITDLGLFGKCSHEKFIPSIYKYTSVENRIALLQGLMDTDGCVKRINGEATFTTSSRQLGLDVVELVKSLGGRARMRGRDRRGKRNVINGFQVISNYIQYDISVRFGNGICPFFLDRKSKYFKQTNALDKIKSIELIGEKEVQCILVENPEHLYITDDFIVTHNTIEDKLNPWMQPIYDNLEFLLGSDFQMLNEYKYNGLIQVEPLTYIRGRSIPKSFMILDEAQNLTAQEIKTIITRMGEDSKIVITGDIEQIDNPYVDFADNGLTHIVERFKDYSIAGHVTLRKGERSELASLASEIL